jgi:hypothetical protein
MPQRIQQATEQAQQALQQIQQMAQQMYEQEQRNAELVAQILGQSNGQGQNFIPGAHQMLGENIAPAGLSSELQNFYQAERTAAQQLRQIEQLARQLQQQQV